MISKIIKPTIHSWRHSRNSKQFSLEMKEAKNFKNNSHEWEIIFFLCFFRWLPPSGAVWDFRVLLVREGLTSDLLELHSTPWSSAQPLDPADGRLQDFQRRRMVRADNSSCLELDLDTLLSQKYSGEPEHSFHRGCNKLLSLKCVFTFAFDNLKKGKTVCFFSIIVTSVIKQQKHKIQRKIDKWCFYLSIRSTTAKK